MKTILPARPVAVVVVVSCHVERPLDDEAWRRFSALQAARPGGFEVVALLRPPHDGENRELWLERAREAAAHGRLGHHTHWTSPTHARPTGGNPAARVREEAEWLRANGLEPTLFCGGGWYMDQDVAETLAELGYTDCTARRAGIDAVEIPSGASLQELPTTHSVGALARAVLARRLPSYVHAYCHDYDLLGARRRLAFVNALRLLRRRGGEGDRQREGESVSFSEAFAR
jgi:hypothetical protein